METQDKVTQKQQGLNEILAGTKPAAEKAKQTID
jgi:hypothetical protein